LSDVESGELRALLDDLRRELGEVVDELDRSRAAHRRVESLLLAVLDNVPTPIIVLDDSLRVRAASASATATWHVSLDAMATGVEELDRGGVVEACRAAFESGHVTSGSMPVGYGAAMIEEPGTGVRYITVWR
jgi:hypothetical protein